MSSKEVVEANLRKMTGADKLDLLPCVDRLFVDCYLFQKVNAGFYCDGSGRITYFSEFPIAPEDYTRPQMRFELMIFPEKKFFVSRAVLPRNASAEMKENLEATILEFNERFGLKGSVTE